MLDDPTGWKRVRLPAADAEGANHERPKALPRDSRGHRMPARELGFWQRYSEAVGLNADVQYRKRRAERKQKGKRT